MSVAIEMAPIGPSVPRGRGAFVIRSGRSGTFAGTSRERRDGPLSVEATIPGRSGPLVVSAGGRQTQCVESLPTHRPSRVSSSPDASLSEDAIVMRMTSSVLLVEDDEDHTLLMRRALD